jgi:hypothetical protein
MNIHFPEPNRISDISIGQAAPKKTSQEKLKALGDMPSLLQQTGRSISPKQVESFKALAKLSESGMKGSVDHGLMVAHERLEKADFPKSAKLEGLISRWNEKNELVAKRKAEYPVYFRGGRAHQSETGRNVIYDAKESRLQVEKQIEEEIGNILENTESWTPQQKLNILLLVQARGSLGF